MLTTGVDCAWGILYKIALTRLTMKIKNKYNNNIFIKTRINKKDKDNNAV
jgi:hypothetical protein